ncbi:MAG TPA: DUF222 domain-containing protein [Pseudonocardia sp.]|nr:DUF222 domain-containing protein [Pseudonocardia sp.]
MSLSTLPPGDHPAADALAVLAGGLDQFADANLWALSDGEVLQVRVGLARLSSRLASAGLRTTRELDGRNAAQSAGATSVVGWLVDALGVLPGEALREVRLACALDGDLPAAAAALAAGEITPAKVAVIAESDRALAAVATAAERAQAEALLVEQAPALNVRALQTAATHLGHRLDPGRGERLADEEEAQVARRELRLYGRPDGSARLAGQLDKEAAAFLRTALDPLAKPRPAGHPDNPADDADRDDDAGPGDHAGQGDHAGSGAGRGGGRDPRSAPRRMADALVELVEIALRSGDLPQQAGQPVQLVVAIDLEDLQRRHHTAGTGAGGPGPDTSAGAGAGASADWGAGPAARAAAGWGAGTGTDWGAGAGAGTGAGWGAGAGELDLGLALSIESVRRLACDAQLIPAVLGSHGEPLDVGRAVRSAPPSLRRLLELRDGGCAFPGCDRFARWCRVHHIEHWADGGATSCQNCVLLCGAHHRAVHHQGWEVAIATDGLPDFYPPPWVDPQQRARRNLRGRQLRRRLASQLANGLHGPSGPSGPSGPDGPNGPKATPIRRS